MKKRRKLGLIIAVGLVTATEECDETERGCVRSTSRTGSAGPCVLGSFHRH